jgi:hypothetical protein
VRTGASFGRTCKNASDLHGKPYNFKQYVFFLLALIIVAIAVAISIFRHNISLGSGIGREDSCIASERAEQSRISGSMKKFLVVVLPDGTIVTPRVAE